MNHRIVVAPEETIQYQLRILKRHGLCTVQHVLLKMISLLKLSNMAQQSEDLLAGLQTVLEPGSRVTAVSLRYRCESAVVMRRRYLDLGQDQRPAVPRHIVFVLPRYSTSLWSDRSSVVRLCRRPSSLRSFVLDLSPASPLRMFIVVIMGHLSSQYWYWGSWSSSRACVVALIRDW